MNLPVLTKYKSLQTSFRVLRSEGSYNVQSFIEIILIGKLLISCFAGLHWTRSSPGQRISSWSSFSKVLRRPLHTATCSNTAWQREALRCRFRSQAAESPSDADFSQTAPRPSLPYRPDVLFPDHTGWSHEALVGFLG